MDQNDRVTAFWIGNIIGIAILIGGILLSRPQKLKQQDVLDQQKQMQQLSKPADQATQPKTIPTKPEN